MGNHQSQHSPVTPVALNPTHAHMASFHTLNPQHTHIKHLHPITPYTHLTLVAKHLSSAHQHIHPTLLYHWFIFRNPNSKFSMSSSCNRAATSTIAPHIPPYPQPHEAHALRPNAYPAHRLCISTTSYVMPDPRHVRITYLRQRTKLQAQTQLYINSTAQHSTRTCAKLFQQKQHKHTSASEHQHRQHAGARCAALQETRLVVPMASMYVHVYLAAT